VQDAGFRFRPQESASVRRGGVCRACALHRDEVSQICINDDAVDPREFSGAVGFLGDVYVSSLWDASFLYYIIS
jgi:hypothetical protein